MTRLGLLLALLLQVAPAQRARVAWVPDPRARSGGWVSDAARHLRPATIDSLNAIIGALEAATSAEIGVAVVDSTAGLELQEFATALHRVWGVGKQGKDNGVLVLWDPPHRGLFISVGYGLEGAIPDRLAGRIRDEAFVPAFRDGRFDEGMIAGVRALADAARRETDPRQGPAAAAPSRRGSLILGTVGGALAALLAGLGGFTGWRRWKRVRPRRCANGHPMRRLGPHEELARLDQAAQLEQSLRSLDWDVWLCDSCGDVQRHAYRLSGRWTECPDCHRRTVKTHIQVIDQPTTQTTGLSRHTTICKNCGAKTKADHVLPRLPVASASGGSSDGGGSGGGGSDGGSSFGGGSAGGGGAGGSY